MNTPKPLIFYKGKPMIKCTLDLYKNYVDKIFVVGYYLADQIKEYLECNYKDVELIIDPKILNTGGSLQYHYEKIMENNSDHYILTVADHETKLSCGELIKYHTQVNNDITYLVGKPSQLNNTLHIKDNNEVSEFIYSNNFCKHHSKASSIGEFVFKKSVFQKYLLLKEIEHIEYDFIWQLINKVKIGAFFVENWKDLGTHDNLIS